IFVVSTSMRSRTITHLAPVPRLDMAAHLKDDASHPFSLSTPPRVSGSDCCQTQRGMQTSWHLPCLCDSS
ncbi:hypothetical protein JOQ06_028458, partial [Pogonophryne albipinna]